ncbi:Uncharacterised protein [uncultured Clostridium sp.]|nr:Uncharacterised protein [uncultured Clostridium sp.]
MYNIMGNSWEKHGKNMGSRVEIKCVNMLI